MKNFLLISAFIALVAQSAFAETLRAEANMIVKSTKFGFFNARDVKIQLFEDQANEPVSVTISWTDDDEVGQPVFHTMDLVVENVDFYDGAEIIQAELKAPSLRPDLGQARIKRDYHEQNHRFLVVLYDYSKSVTMDAKQHLWKASVNEGYGWCATMDARMELVGNPTFEGNPLFR